MSEEKIILQQGETCAVNIALDEELSADCTLLCCISDSYKVRKYLREEDGDIVRVDNQHFLFNLTCEDTYSLSAAFLEIAYTTANKEVVTIGNEAVRLYFKPNRIKEVLR